MINQFKILFLLFSVYALFLSACKNDPEPVSKSDDKTITSFSFDALTPAAAGIITGTTITVAVPYGTTLAALNPTIAVSAKATISPASNVTQDFTKTVTYTVTAENGTTERYAVIVTVAKPADNGTVYIGNADGNLFAIDALTGIKKWDFKAADAINATPTVVDNVLYIASWDKKLYALDAATGAKKWESDPADIKLNQPYAAPLVANGTLYYGGSNFFYALDASTGTKKWEFRDDELYGWEASPTIADGIVYASIRGTGPKVGIYGLDAGTGVRKWKAAKTFVTESSPAIFGGYLYAGSEYDGLNAFDLTTGALKWNFDSGFITHSSPTIANGIVYVGASALANRNNDKLLAVDALTGLKKWEFKTSDGAPDYSSPIVVSGTVYIGAGGTIYAVDATSGSMKWEAKPEDNNTIQSGPVVATGIVYIGIGKKLYAYDSATGAKRWEYDTGRAISQSSPCVIAKDGKVYHGGISGTVQ